MPTPETAKAARLLEDAIGRRVFPAAGAEVGSARGTIWRAAFGGLTFDAAAPSTTDRTLFDLASLTKPIATATIAVDLIRAGALALDERVAAFFPEWRGEDREGVMVADLLEHASGLPARLLDQP